jgi:hypothetical protein
MNRRPVHTNSRAVPPGASPAWRHECDFDADHPPAAVQISASYRGRAFITQVCWRCARKYGADGPATPAERAWFAQVCGEWRACFPLDAVEQPRPTSTREPRDGRTPHPERYPR